MCVAGCCRWRVDLSGNTGVIDRKTHLCTHHRTLLAEAESCGKHVGCAGLDRQAEILQHQCQAITGSLARGEGRKGHGQVQTMSLHAGHTYCGCGIKPTWSHHGGMEVVLVAKLLSPEQDERHSHKHIPRNKVDHTHHCCVCNATDEPKVPDQRRSRESHGAVEVISDGATRTYNMIAEAIDARIATIQLNVSPLPMNTPMHPF